MKENVYETEIGSREELVTKINTTAMEIHQRRLGNVQQEISEMKQVFLREGDILSICSSQPLELVGARREGDTEQWSKYKQLTTELSDKMAMESNEDRCVMSHNSETETNSEKVY